MLGLEGTTSSTTTRSSTQSLLELFLAGRPGGLVRAAVGELQGDAWQLALHPLTNMTAQVGYLSPWVRATLFYFTQLLWPRCAAPTFLHFLLTAGQQWVVQQYCRLLATWCDWHCHARQFLLASALLNSGEPEKACDLFLSAAGGVPSDEFLTQHLLQLQGDTSDDLAIAYYLKVKRHEEMGLP